MNWRKGIVYFDGSNAGTLEEWEEGYRFWYDEQYLNNVDAQPISLTLGLHTPKYESPTLFSFFDGLIPEGWLLQIAIDSWKLDRQDRFGILLRTCRDTIGAVSVVPVS
ncbi:MAG TPA: HipA N-terminal domain-containing protein [Sphaerochaeta sp.]|nr:HipA N-terminal domain-containing protein [Sphaerochaeta sp.]